MAKQRRGAARSDSERRLRQSLRFSRVLRLMQRLHTGPFLTAEQLSQEFECSIRTIRRDLQILELAGIPWYYDRETRTYRIRANDHRQNE